MGMKRERRLAVTLHLQGHTVLKRRASWTGRPSRRRILCIAAWRTFEDASWRRGYVRDRLRGLDERLAEAFWALGDTHAAEVPEDLRERIWLAVSGALSPEERRELVERTVTDPGCAETWRVASEMWRASQASAVGGVAVLHLG